MWMSNFPWVINVSCTHSTNLTGSPLLFPFYFKLHSLIPTHVMKFITVICIKNLESWNKMWYCCLHVSYMKFLVVIARWARCRRLCFWNRHNFWELPCIAYTGITLIFFTWKVLPSFKVTWRVDLKKNVPEIYNLISKKVAISEIKVLTRKFNTFSLNYRLEKLLNLNKWHF